MKARVNVRRLSNAERRDLSRQMVDAAFPAVMAAVLYVLHLRRWHKDRIVKLYDDVCALLAVPIGLRGKCLDDRQVEEYLARVYGIDWDKIRQSVQIETGE